MKRDGMFSTFLQTIITCMTLFIFIHAHVFACTIVSGISASGQVWNANNEDGPAGMGTFINVFPSTQKGEYGYFTLSYSLADANNGGIQGGMNEAGLTFDFNSIREVKNLDRKNPFPGGDSGILSHILATMDSVNQVVAFFETYWFQGGFNSAQMHVADSHGQFVIISPSGVVRTTKQLSLVSTNFDIAGRESSASCTRYAFATQKMQQSDASYSTMLDILKQTANGTLYSNIQNLTTGEVWFFTNLDFDKPVKTTVKELISKGQKSYSFDDMESVVSGKPMLSYKPPQKIELPSSLIATYVGSYRHPLGAIISVSQYEKGIRFSADGIPTTVLYPQSKNTFFWPNENAFLVFEKMGESSEIQMSVFENGYRSFTAKRVLL